MTGNPMGIRHLFEQRIFMFTVWCRKRTPSPIAAPFGHVDRIRGRPRNRAHLLERCIEVWRGVQQGSCIRVSRLFEIVSVSPISANSNA